MLAFYSIQTLPGNVDRNTKNKNFLKSVIKARAIRIYPVKWNKKPSMRVEIYGCSGLFNKATIVLPSQENSPIKNL